MAQALDRRLARIAFVPASVRFEYREGAPNDDPFTARRYPGRDESWVGLRSKLDVANPTPASRRSIILALQNAQADGGLQTPVAELSSPADIVIRTRAELTAWIGRTFAMDVAAGVARVVDRYLADPGLPDPRRTVQQFMATKLRERGLPVVASLDESPDWAPRRRADEPAPANARPENGDQGRGGGLFDE